MKTVTVKKSKRVNVEKRMRRRRESYFNWKFSHNCCFKFSRLCRFSFPITLCIHSFRSFIPFGSFFSKNWTEQHLYSSFFHIHSFIHSSPVLLFLILFFSILKFSIIVRIARVSSYRIVHNYGTLGTTIHDVTS